MSIDGYLLGYDIGSSSVKATVIEASTGRVVASATSPDNVELEIIAEKPGWAEQHPDTWWKHVQKATEKIRASSSVNLHDVKAIGISYQMHGLVMLDKLFQPLAPSIIWCDSRAVPVGQKALKEIGQKKCLSRLLNPPGNFTASKLKWVAENRKTLYRSVYRFMLPGDYIALKLTGEATTTASGLSEGILWDFKAGKRADFLLDHYGINPDSVPPLVPTFGVQGTITAEAASLLGITAGIPVSYRAGDQPNNALSLNVLQPGEIAATAGTSGVVYGVTDITSYDAQGRVNTFLHVNSTGKAPRLGILLCVNGTGILNRWLRTTLGSWSSNPISYVQMDQEAESAPPCCDGLRILPYGNGAERTLGNLTVGASIHGLDLTRHSRAHLLRAAQEGIVFALMNGIDIMRSMGLKNRVVRAGNANMFKSRLFAEVFATVAGSAVELYNTDGAQGAARGAGVGAGIYKGLKDAFANLTVVRRIEPDRKLKAAYGDAYRHWLSICGNQVKSAKQG
ncbi:MAG: carbohydrate kinase [Chitinispirillaceae bacterium]|nr:carbohydrate kinase [Chitinispirillaceae bacterium]